MEKKSAIILNKQHSIIYRALHDIAKIDLGVFSAAVDKLIATNPLHASGLYGYLCGHDGTIDMIKIVYKAGIEKSYIETWRLFNHHLRKGRIDVAKYIYSVDKEVYMNYKTLKLLLHAKRMDIIDKILKEFEGTSIFNSIIDQELANKK